MIVLAGADLVLPDRVVPGGSLIIHDGRIEAIESRVIDAPAGATRVDLTGHLIVPGFVDVHIHGIEGLDVLDGPEAIAGVAARLPKYGVTAFCPTSIACAPAGAGHDAGGGRRRAARAAPAFGPRHAGAPREQFHQPGMEWRAAAALPSPAATE